MCFLRCVLVTSILLGVSFLLGCGEEQGKPMKGMQPGATTEPREMDVKTKTGEIKKVMPPEEPSPKAPPRPGRGQ